ncbi:MAG: putative polynucleotide kinase [Prokaryotic dsDNA virus sp.]|nr:MAG: putative polynucleotide kinase [Prokaryotic dsDNA virus sp.]|tara:strand:+ start:13131 stop:13637 length:507 start_codon:yes stop_codon:yes gene_type:complete
MRSIKKDTTRKNTVIFDLDGTIAKIDKRRELATVPSPSHLTKSKGKIDWDVFFDPLNIDLDWSNKPVVESLKLFYNDGYEIIILSGRLDTTKIETEKWLKKHHIPYDELYMRPEDCRYIPDDILKWEMLKWHDIDKKDIFCIFDDRKRVVDMWRTEGLTCFQVAEGNF